MTGRDDDECDVDDDLDRPSRRHTDRRRPGFAFLVFIGIGILFTSGWLNADTRAVDGSAAEPVDEPVPALAQASDSVAAPDAGSTDELAPAPAPAPASAPEPAVEPAPGSAPEPEAATDPAAESRRAPAPDAASAGLIPRDAIIDMTRAQTGIICSSEAFLACMGFDGTTCLTLSESAIDACLVPLPAEIDPASLDNAALEACPKAIYEEAGYDETEANACFMQALEGS